MTDILIPAWVDGRLTPVEKLAVHQRGLRHRAISVFVWRGDEVLLQKRAAHKYHTPGLWTNTCCTHPKWQEGTRTCAQRRLREELGISGLTLDLQKTAEYRADVGGGLIEHEVVDIFFADAPPDMGLALNPDEVEEIAWVTLAELKRRIDATPSAYTPWLRIYLDEHASLFDSVPS